MPVNEEDGEDYYRSGMRGTPTARGTKVQASRRPSVTSTSDDVDDLTKQMRHVQFSDAVGLELESTQATTLTHHPTPMESRPVINNTSSRRLAIDEVELCFSEATKFPASVNDYAVRKFASSNGVIIGSQIDCMESALIGRSRWVTYWGELYNGILMLYKIKDSVEKKRFVVPISGCSLRITNAKDCELEIEYTYQGHQEFKTFKFDSRSDLYIWWWALQLASVDRNEKGYQTSMRQAVHTPLNLLENSVATDHVLFHRPERANSTRRTMDRPSVTHLIIVRHGEAENMHFNVPDKEKCLTKRGLQQAALAAAEVAKNLAESGGDRDNVQLIYGGLKRTYDTAKEFERAMPWIQYTYECCLLEEGDPGSIPKSDLVDFRAAMHRMASEYVSRSDHEDPRRSSTNESFKILIGHASFIQYFIARAYGVSKEVVKIGAPIGHCSITQIDIVHDVEGERSDVAFTNRVKHLPLTHRTSE